MESILMTSIEISKKTVAIVKFGPASPSDGMRAAEYFQVTIDPAMASPSGELIRFGSNQADEIIGWQRINALTIVEILGVWNDEGSSPEMTIGRARISMLAVEKE